MDDDILIDEPIHFEPLKKVDMVMLTIADYERLETVNAAARVFVREYLAISGDLELPHEMYEALIALQSALHPRGGGRAYIERLEAFVAKMRVIPQLAEGHNSAHNWASMRVEEALKALDADE